ncbi:MAG: hypothetical protein HY556_06385 [Euryarchaeota archaeon]|nr:hypothetical protein [Euryarchaeota archaeon]
MDPLVPAAAGMIGLAFAIFVASKFREKRRTSDALWTVGLLLYAIVSFIEAWVMIGGWTIPLYRIYFVMAPSLVGLLGAGTIRFVADAKKARFFTVFIAVLIAVAAVGQLAIVLHLDTPVTSEGTTMALNDWGSELGGKAIPFPQPARVAFLLLNIVGGLALILGALWSWRATKRIGVLLIAFGAMLPFAAGSLSTLGLVEARIIAQFLGITLMFAGFIKSQDAVGATKQQAANPQ